MHRLFCLLAIVSCAACGSYWPPAMARKAHEEPRRTFQKLGFAVTAPSGWDTQIAPDYPDDASAGGSRKDLLGVYVLCADAGLGMYVKLVPNPEGRSLWPSILHVKERLSREPGWMVGRVQAAEPGGWFFRAKSPDPQDPFKMYVHEWFVVPADRDDAYFIVSASGDEGTYELRQKEIVGIIRSLKLLAHT